MYTETFPTTMACIFDSTDRDLIERHIEERMIKAKKVDDDGEPLGKPVNIKELCRLSYDLQDIFERELAKPKHIDMTGFREELYKLRYAERGRDKEGFNPLCIKRKELIKEKSKIKLLPRQVEHQAKLVAILKKSYSAFDLSTMGKGKTENACSIAQELGLRMMVLCPKTVKMVWKDKKEQYDIDLDSEHIINFEKLAGRGASQPDHGLLRRVNYDPKSKNSIDFEVTSHFKELVKSGILLVLDECQFIKEESTQKYKACLALTSYITSGSKSRILFLSGSPLENPYNFLRVSRYIKQESTHRAAKKKNEGIVLLGVDDLVKSCERLSLDETKEYVQKNGLPFTKDEVPDFVDHLSYNIMLKKISSAMPAMNIECKLDIAHGFYLLDEYELKQLRTLVKDLKHAIQYDPETKTYNRQRRLEASAYFNQIEELHCKAHIRVIKETLRVNKNAKVFMCVNKQNVSEYLEQLEEFKPVAVTGETANDKLREKYVYRFNNDAKTRVIIGTKVMGTGVNLQDQHGDSPRFCFIAPNTSEFATQQVAKRIYREGSKSDATVRIFWADDPIAGDLLKDMYQAMADRDVHPTAFELQNDKSDFPKNFRSERESATGRKSTATKEDRDDSEDRKDRKNSRKGSEDRKKEAQTEDIPPI